MIIEFTTENYRSIHQEAKLSLVAGKGKELYTENVTEPKLAKGVKKLPILRSAVLYGPNAGGKSNFIKALAAMQEIVLYSSQDQEILNSVIIPFKLSQSTIDKPSVFEVIILINGIRYQYGFSATSEKIYEEWLFAFPKGRPQVWFERSSNLDTEDDIHFGDKLSGNKEVWRKVTRKNALLLSTAVQLNSEQLKPIFDWFKSSLKIIGTGLYPHKGRTSVEWCKDERKGKILEFLQAADFAISDINVSEEDLSPDIFESELLPSSLKAYLKNKDAKEIKLSMSHTSDSGKIVKLDIAEESDGTNKMFNLAGFWLNSLSEGHVLFIDELHAHLHPLLVKFLVQLFHNSKTNKHLAQLIFSTHETSILSQDIFRRDQIWFCERSESQSTKLYSLTEFSPRKGVENLERSYLSGRYGALPYLRIVNENFKG